MDMHFVLKPMIHDLTCRLRFCWMMSDQTKSDTTVRKSLMASDTLAYFECIMVFA